MIDQGSWIQTFEKRFGKLDEKIKNQLVRFIRKTIREDRELNLTSLSKENPMLYLEDEPKADAEGGADNGDAGANGDDASGSEGGDAGAKDDSATGNAGSDA